MSKILVIYGSTTGMMEGYADDIAQKLDATVMNVADVTPEKLQDYDCLLLGTSTWGAGEMQDDWYDGVNTLKKASLGGKVIALFGCGDAAGYPDTFCGGMSEIYDAIKDSGAKVVGFVDAASYTYDDSASVIDGRFVGLALDVNENNDERIAAWVEILKLELQ